MTRALDAPRRALATLLIASAALVAPAAARASDWQQAAAGIPAGVTLNDVAAYTPSGGSPVVIAVGQDTDTKQPVVYRLSGGVLTTEPVQTTEPPVPTDPPTDPPAPPDAELTRVSATGPDAAWAIGTSKDQAGNDIPLIVRYDTATGTWAREASVPFTGLPTALALSGDTGLVGNEDGELYRLDASGVGQKLDPVPAAHGPVTGIALYAGDTGFATVENPSPGPRLYEISPSGVRAAAVAGSTEDLARPLVSVAASSADDAFAIDGTSFWTPASGVWTRKQSGFAFSGQVTLNDAAAAADGHSSFSAIAGASDGAGTVWRRGGGGAWARDPGVSAAPLNGVAAAPTGELWAVGTGGAFLHYTPPPAAAPPGGGGGGDTGGGSGEQQTTSSGGQESPAPSPSEPTPTPIAVTVDQPPSTGGERNGGRKPPRRRGRLLTRVTVKLAGHKLIVRFRLRARARVGVIAKRGRRVVGRRAMRIMNRGRARIELRYRGRRPPTELKIVAHAVRKRS